MWLLASRPGVHDNAPLKDTLEFIPTFNVFFYGYMTLFGAIRIGDVETTQI